MKIFKEKIQVKRPVSCSVEVLRRCLLRCKMCYMWKYNSNPEEIAVSELNRFIDDIRDFLIGERVIVFGGGEPLLKKGIWKVVEHAVKNRLKTIVTSNGVLINKEIARAIADSGLNEIYIALDGIKEETHDFLRGVKGTYENVMNAFDYLNGYALKKGIITIISGYNLDELLGLIKWARTTCISIYFQVIQRPFHSRASDDWYKEEEYRFLWPEDVPKVCSIIDEIIRLTEEGFPIDNPKEQLTIYKKYFQNPEGFTMRKKCRFTDYTINITEEGEAHLCCFMKPIGNIKRERITELWYSEVASQVRADMNRCNKNCHNIINCFFKEDD